MALDQDSIRIRLQFKSLRYDVPKYLQPVALELPEYSKMGRVRILFFKLLLLRIFLILEFRKNINLPSEQRATGSPITATKLCALVMAVFKSLSLDRKPKSAEASS